MSHIADFVATFLHQLIARPSGPLGFRFILQPLTAIALAIRDGIKDARHERSPYFWTIQHDKAQRMALLKEGVKALSRLLIITALVDIIYQIIVFHGLRPLETGVITLVLAFLPYLILRGPVQRIANSLMQRNAAHHEAPRPQAPLGRNATRTADPGTRDRNHSNDTD
jgi:hypothetical protein